MSSNSFLDRKGVTPVISVVLLMTISIAATGTAYTYIMNTQDTFKDNAEDRLENKERQRDTDLNIEHIYKANNTLLMVVRNTGNYPQIMDNENDEKMWNLYIGGTPVGGDGTGWKYIDGDSNPDRRTVLASSSTIVINSTHEFPAKGAEIDIKLVGRHGSKDSYVCRYDGGKSC